MNLLLEREETQKETSPEARKREESHVTVRVSPEQEGVHTPAMTLDGRPDPQRVRGCCPECGEALISNLYYLGEKGYLLVWECWASLGENPECTYRRVL
ncbi:MAG: hypothetical protein OHK0029_30760 [Armatimonadaceae bacterium]